MTVVPFSVHRLVNVVYRVLLSVLLALLVGMAEPIPVPVIAGVVAFAEIEKDLLAEVVALAVTTALWVWMTAVPFSVHKLVNVVYRVLLRVPLALFVGVAEIAPVPLGKEEVALAEIEILLLADVVAFAVTTALWVCNTVVPFSTHRLVKVV